VSSVKAVLLDAGGVLILPDPVRLAAMLGQHGVGVDHDVLARCHYDGMCALDALDGTDFTAGSPYLGAYARRLGIATELLDAPAWTAFGAFWTHPIDGSLGALRELERRGVPVVIVSNSGGEVENELRRAGVCQAGPGEGACVVRVIDSSKVGSRKPEPRIFEIALETLGLGPQDVIHIGDSVRFDVEGARGVGIRPIHFDPFELCALDDHEHITSLEEVTQLL
jgi:putative hydrolase of the HAD superfamily